MGRLLTAFICLFCFVLNASMMDISPVQKSGFPTIQTTNTVGDLNIQENSADPFVKGFRIPRGALPKGGAFKPKGQPPKSQPKSGGKETPKGSHEKNQRESNREKHENADARRQKEQQKAEEKREQNKKNK